MSTRIAEQWLTMLNAVAARNASVELSRGVSHDAAATIAYRSRAFEVLPDGGVIVETPRQAVQDQSFGNGDDIELTLMQNNERLVATCTIKETLTYEVNDSLRITCYRLSAGRRPMREQRRSFYRVTVAAMELKPVVLKSESAGKPFVCEGRLVNISGGGLGVSLRAARAVLNQIKRTRRFECFAWLSDDQQIDVPVRIAHIEALGDDGLYLGLKFEIEDETRASHLAQKMQQRCTEIQRMQLQRRRA